MLLRFGFVVVGPNPPPEKLRTGKVKEQRSVKSPRLHLEVAALLHREAVGALGSSRCVSRPGKSLFLED